MTIRDVQREIRKSNRSDENYDRVRGVGTAAAGAGLLAGGIPGETSDSAKFELRDVKRAHRKPKAALSSLRGGILGYRVDAHQRRELFPAEQAKVHHNPDADPWHSYHQGRDLGTIDAEKKIIRNLKTGRKVANVALVGGTGAVLAANAAKSSNAHKKIKVGKSQISKARRKRRYQAQVAGGAALTAGSVGGASLLDRAGASQAKKAGENLDAANKLAPGMGGWTHARSAHRVPHVKPDLSDEYISDRWFGENWNPDKNPVSEKDFEKAGKHRSMAAKQRYFAHTLGGNAKNVRRYGIPLGVAGVALGSKNVQHKTDKARFRAADYVAPTGQVRKNVVGPFGIIHKMAWNAANTPKYWKIKAMAEGGTTAGERNVWGQKLKSFTDLHGEGKGAPHASTAPGTSRRPPAPPPPQPKAQPKAQPRPAPPRTPPPPTKPQSHPDDNDWDRMFKQREYVQNTRDWLRDRQDQRRWDDYEKKFGAGTW